MQIRQQTFYYRRKQNSGMETNQLKELKRLQKENDRLCQAVSNLSLDQLILSEAARVMDVQESIQWNNSGLNRRNL